MKSCYFCNTEYIDQDYDGNSAFPIVKGFEQDHTVCSTCNQTVIVPIRQLFKKYKIDARTNKNRNGRTLYDLMFDEDRTIYCDEPSDAYILVDYKLNAIIGVFSTFDKVREAKSGVVRRDTDMIKQRIEKEITLDKLTQERKQYLIGKLNTIDLIYSDYEKRWETSYIDFDDVAPLNRYGWYRMKMDMFRLDKTMFGPIVMLPPPKDNK